MNSEVSSKRSILFVDDEPNILRGLRRMLRSMRHEWTMQFAESGAQALEMMKDDVFDVVVSDMRMPGMDGAELLANIKELYPKTVRIVLSGHSDQEMIMKSVRTAHQYLAKPCDPDKLKTIISRSCALRDILDQESIKLIVTRMESLPSLPDTYIEITEQLEKEEGSIKQVAEIISRDLGMTAKILQLVNSAFFGIPRHISSPAEAVVLLGLDMIHALVLTIGIFSKFEKSLLRPDFIKAIYDHSLAVGAISKNIAISEGYPQKTVEDAFMAGLLHDLGKLILAESFPEMYMKAKQLSEDKCIPIHQAEILVFGSTHAEVGGYLLGLWGLPDLIVEGVAFHHTPDICPINDIILHGIIHAANAFEHRMKDNNELYQDIEINYFKELGINNKLKKWEQVSKETVQGDDDV